MAPLPMRVIFALTDRDGDGTTSLQEFQTLTKASSKRWTLTRMAPSAWRRCGTSSTEGTAPPQQSAPKD